ncbi:hypothetical protein P8452_15095 [Trifolium repens]|nr:hypothetical protein P8452_15095 [Trifolium repens]
MACLIRLVSSKRPLGFSQEVPEEDFKSLLEYWRDEKTQEVSHQNAQNIAQLKFRHRTGNKSFAVIRENMRLSSEDKEPPTQAQVFIATRQSRKGNELDKETNSAIIQLQDMIEKHEQPSSEAFQTPTVDANRASTSTHAPNDNEMMNNDDSNEEMQDYEDEEM